MHAREQVFHREGLLSFFGLSAGQRGRFPLQLPNSRIIGEFVMRYLVWILRLVVFVVVLMFALKNTGPVDVRFFADHVVAGVPLIVVMLVVFVLGAIFGFL